MPEIAVRLPPLDEIARRWAAIEPLLKRATDRSAAYEPIDLLRLTMAGRMAVWLIERGDELLAALTTQFHDYPRLRALELVFIGGRGLSLWHRQVNDAMDEFARRNGCACVTTFGRPGWEKIGFAADGTMFTRHLK